MNLPEPTTLKLSKIEPYENNPRDITEEAIEAVKHSIDSYGYVQPIVVDQDNVIIAGHTRFQALQALGQKTTEVYKVEMTPEQAQKYRLVDNRTHELSDWSHEELITELREWEDDLLQQFFPNVNLEVGKATKDAVTEDQVVAGAVQASTIKQAKPVHMTDVKCPSCRDTFQVKTTTLPGLTMEDVDELLSE